MDENDLFRNFEGQTSFKTKDVAEILGETASMIRYYCKEFDFFFKDSIATTESNHRIFTRENIIELEKIILMAKEGMQLRAIKEKLSCVSGAMEVVNEGNPDRMADMLAEALAPRLKEMMRDVVRQVIQEELQEEKTKFLEEKEKELELRESVMQKLYDSQAEILEKVELTIVNTKPKAKRFGFGLKKK